jgi:hAT family C-terminal dimerisation region
VDQWEYHNYDRDDVMRLLESEPTKTSLSTIQHEIDFYLTKADKPEKKFRVDCDVLEYWKGHEQQMPMLARLAREIFANPATSASSEQTFSAA